ncbi:MAG: hypothetical protein ACTS3F_07735 [Phycisphaerales bacterium]
MSGRLPDSLPGYVPPRRVAIIATACLCAAGLVVWAGVMVLGTQGGTGGKGALGRFGPLVSIGLLASLVLPWLLVVGLWAHERRTAHRVRSMEFLACGACVHDLRGLGRCGVCPECGREFDSSAVQAAWLLAFGDSGGKRRDTGPEEDRRAS